MKTKAKNRTQKNQSTRNAGESRYIFAHRPAMAYVLGLAGMTPQQIVRGALPGFSNAGDLA